ncbi:50S ribosomal protein L25 [Malonomonas rubra]|uniref:50S ribosomal protein L25 n=1 Tax=Malonomonas rubra TaxID=57040 RepID=UPI0026EDED9C|nr:50S ribosomal protein L25 [Malonomonas rubra]
MAQAELNVEIRENTGKGVARKLRAAGKVPAVVYGKGMEPTAITVEPKALEQAVDTEAGWNTLLTLKGAPAVEGKIVVLKELDLHPLRREMVCADFHAIDLKTKNSFMVPVVTVGKSEGEKAGGSLQVIRHELEVLCLPTAVPQSIEIDVAALQIGDVVHVEEVTVPEGAELVYDVNFTVITVVGHKAEVEEGEEGEGGEATEAAEE